MRKSILAAAAVLAFSGAASAMDRPAVDGSCDMYSPDDPVSHVMLDGMCYDVRYGQNASILEQVMGEGDEHMGDEPSTEG